MASVELVGVSKLYGTHARRRRRQPEDPGRQLLLPARAVGLRQDQHAAHDRRPRERSASGDILIGDEVVNDLPPVRRGTAMMFQTYALFPHLSCVDNVAFSLQMRGVAEGRAPRSRRERMLERVHMEQYAERLPAQLSGGQQQRVALARALITNPQGAAARRAALGARPVPARSGCARS